MKSDWITYEFIIVYSVLIESSQAICERFKKQTNRKSHQYDSDKASSISSKKGHKAKYEAISH